MSRFLAALLLSTLVSLANAATPEAEIIAAESKLAAGLSSRDVKLLEPLIAEHFTWVHASDGRVDDRQAWIANAARGMALSGQRSERSEYEPTLEFYGEPPHTAVRVSRVRLIDATQNRESWMRQTHTWVRGSAGEWRLAVGQGVLMYDGPTLDVTLHARYAGVYELADGRRLTLAWKAPTLLATFPSGAQTQIFLGSATDEVIRTAAAGSLHFTLDLHGEPQSVALMRAGREVWRANRKS